MNEVAEAIKKRQDAARKWIEAFRLKRETKPVKGKVNKALAVLVLTFQTSDWLAENDPFALRQAQEALDGSSYCDYLHGRTPKATVRQLIEEHGCDNVLSVVQAILRDELDEPEASGHVRTAREALEEHN